MHDIIKWIHKLMAKTWTQETIPAEWERAIITPIFKKGNHLKCKNYIGISLQCHVWYEKGWELNRSRYLAFLDLKKTFDRVPRSKLWNVMDEPL